LFVLVLVLSDDICYLTSALLKINATIAKGKQKERKEKNGCVKEIDLSYFVFVSISTFPAQ